MFFSLKENELILTNLPRESKEMSSTAEVQNFLLTRVHRDLDVKKIEFINSVVCKDQQERLAYVKVTLGSKR